MKILLVEDDDVLARATTRTLRKADYDVIRVEDAIAAVSTARTELPDLVVLDLGLPAGGGVAVLQRLRALSATSLVPVVVVTGGATPEQMAQLRDQEYEALLTKPVEPQELLDTIREALG